MKQLVILFLFLPTLLFAQQKGFTITGNVSGITEGDVRITNLQGDQVLADGKIANGQFTLKGVVSEPGLHMLYLGQEQPQYLFVENGAIRITGSKATIGNLAVEGSVSHKDFMDFQAVFNPIFMELNTLANQLQQAEGTKKEALMGQYQMALSKLNTEIPKFITAKKSSYVSPFLLLNTAQVTPSPAELENRFNMLDAKIRNSEAGKNLSNYINYMKVGAIGSEALDFTQNDPEGHPVKLSSFKGKYVLVDFWASWCRPCRIENPNVVKAFDKFKAKNFTVLGVSLDSNKDNWVKAINDDKLAWTHVSDLKQWNNEVAVMYHVTSIPQNLLLDPNGRIVAKDLRGEDLEKKLCELLGCN